MDKKELIEKIISKKEFSRLPKKDVEIAFGKFNSEEYSDEEKIKSTRDLLRKIYSVFSSRKLLNIKNKDAEWLMRKHISTRERLPHYKKLYERILKGINEPNIFDLGAGINGLSYTYFGKKKFYYVGIEAVGQLSELMNYYFKTRRVENCMSVHMSLFELKEIKKYLRQVKGEKIIFLFKVIDSLEMLERDYSKKLLKWIAPLADRIAVSFATRSLVKGKKFNANRKWILDFIKDNFNVLDDFELGGERYVVFAEEK